ncbi:MAG: phospholipase [Kiritimatiellae bacterium]|nr:phospholipase [Kiritimatiellia bacterium]
MPQTHFLTDAEIYRKVILEAVPAAERFLWLATADLKDLYVEKEGNWVPFLEILSELAGRGVAIRLLHAREPGAAFRRDFDRYPNLAGGLEQILCPRVHFKSVIVDARLAYTGSANLTGAGMGARNEHRRNFENGILTTDPALVERLMAQFDAVWMGAHCAECERKPYCADYPDLLPGGGQPPGAH